MRAITVCQPYAELLVSVDALGAPVKPFENRKWFTSYRGPLLIHAGKSRGWLDDCELYALDPKALTFGAVVGQVDLVECLPKRQYMGERDRQRWGRWAHLFDHEHANGPHCFALENMRRLTAPVPWGGEQGLWIPDADLVSLVNKQL